MRGNQEQKQIVGKSKQSLNQTVDSVLTLENQNSMKSDPTMKTYWRNRRRFADLINGALFHGQDMIHPEDLTEQDTDESTIVKKRNKSSMTINRNRDIVKMNKSDAGFVLLGLENQQETHPYMPLRIAMYDILDYNNQEKAWKEKYTKKKAGKNTEGQNVEENRLAKVSQLRLIPIYTLVIYYGEKEWNDAVSLSDLMDIPEEMKEYVNDWHCKVIQVRSYDKELFHDEEVQNFFDACQRIYQAKHDPDEFTGLYLDPETAIAVGVATGVDRLVELAESMEKSS